MTETPDTATTDEILEAIGLEPDYIRDLATNPRMTDQGGIADTGWPVADLLEVETVDAAYRVMYRLEQQAIEIATAQATAIAENRDGLWAHLIGGPEDMSESELAEWARAQQLGSRDALTVARSNDRAIIYENDEPVVYVKCHTLRYADHRWVELGLIHGEIVAMRSA